MITLPIRRIVGAAMAAAETETAREATKAAKAG